MRALFPLFAAVLVGCPVLELDKAADLAVVVYDPSGGAIPLPNDAAFDDASGTLDLPTDDLLPAEVALRTQLNTMDGWPSAWPVTFETSKPMDPMTVARSVEVWELGDQPRLADVLDVVVDDDGLGLVIEPPRHGWVRGGSYAVVVRGGEDGLHSTDGLPFGPDAAMYYLRLDEPLSPGHDRAFPGSSKQERADAAKELEGIRQDLQPVFGLLANRPEPIARDEVAAAFRFTVTTRVELAMDAASQRMPIPFDLLKDPETGLLDLEPAPWDDALETDAKAVASTLDGFSLAADPMFELSGAVDPTTLATNLHLYDLSQTPVEIPVTPVLYAESGTEACVEMPVADDCKYVALELGDAKPLDPDTLYAIAVGGGLLDTEGRPVLPMAIGALVAGDDPVLVDGKSAIGSLDDETASRLETVRASTDLLLDAIGRDGLVTAWPFRTMSRIDALRADVSAAEDAGYAAVPVIEDIIPPTDPFTERDAISQLFPGVLNPAPLAYLGRLDGIDEVVIGTLSMPDHLDPVTRRWVDEPVMRDVSYWATIPEGVDPGDPLPVVIFGHAVVTDRRFMLLVAGALAQRGFATVAIDFPYHGDRIHCVDASLVAVPNFLTEDLQNLTGLTDNLLWFPPCQSGADGSCAPTGECLDADGELEDFSSFPIIDIQPASGAAFLDVHDLPHIPDHFRQAVMDLGTLRYSLQAADWEPVFGRPIYTERLRYAGMSLGGIIGSVYVAADPNIDRAVLNVPGGNMVDLFQDSQFFGPQMDAYLEDIEVEKGSWEHARLVNIAKLIIDSVDPHTVAHVYREDGRPVLIQYDKVNDQLGDIVIPNHTTELLIEVSGLESQTYPSVLHGDLVIPVVGDAMLEDLADHLAVP